MSDYFAPELGQALFCYNYNGYECPKYIVDDLMNLNDEIAVAFNIRPGNNEGSNYTNNVFSMRSYYWGICEEHNETESQPTICVVCAKKCDPNFTYNDFSVSWYKYLGRGVSCNKIITREESKEMYLKCLNSLVSL